MILLGNTDIAIKKYSNLIQSLIECVGELDQLPKFEFTIHCK